MLPTEMVLDLRVMLAALREFGVPDETTTSITAGELEAILSRLGEPLLLMNDDGTVTELTRCEECRFLFLDIDKHVEESVTVKALDDGRDDGSR